MSVIEEYFQYHNECSKKFGKKIIVFMEVGSFLEAYQTSDIGPDLSEISRLINVVRTKKNNKCSDVNIKNPYMLGFPVSSSSERVKILTDNGYTIIIVKQITFPPQKVVRKISNIYSPGVNVLSYTSEQNTIVSLYVKEEQVASNDLLSIGMVSCDVTTGKIFVYESYATIEDDKLSLDKTLQFIETFHPREFIVYMDVKNIKAEFVKSYLDITDAHAKYIDEINPHYFKLPYQCEMIKKIYKNHGIMNPIEFIGMEKLVYCTVSFVILLDYVNSINPDLLFNLEIPIIFCSKPSLYLGNNALMQLNIFNNHNVDTSNKKFKSLFDIINNTSTSMGQRYLKSVLCSPFVDEDVIYNIYDVSDGLMFDKGFKKYEKLLKTIGDIEKIYRKMLIGIISTNELFVFIQGMTIISQIVDLTYDDPNVCEVLNYPKNIDNVKHLIEYCCRIFNVEILRTFNRDIPNSYYNVSIHPDIDMIYVSLNDKINFIENLREKLSSLLDKENMLTTKKNDRDGYYYGITKVRALQLQEKLKTLSSIQIGNTTINTSDIVFKPNPVGIVKIVVPEIDSNSDDISSIREELYHKLENHFATDIDKIVSKFGATIKNSINFISKFDYYVSNAKTSSLYGYSRPIIDAQKYGYIECEQLRHPIIERLIEHEYITHDVSLGKKNLKGMLLYGINSSGKSSMMKAIGISIIMAQCGLFVPAKKFIYSPYTSIFTRISGNDNIFKELSSFSVEMIELKAIWKRSDMKTLIIGDEVCRGTENVSGSAIVAATLSKLSQQKSSFIFATHLHEIIKLPQIKAIENIKAFHLSVSYDSKNDRLVFDRILKEGSGEEIYGVTVAKYIIQDDEFTTMANELKNELLGVKNYIVQPKVSKYNSQLYIDNCSICGKQLQIKDDIVNLDTHHINHQKDCIDGVVGDKKFIKKNDKSNLLVLCKKCHTRVHNKEIVIDKYTSSTTGKILKHFNS